MNEDELVAALRARCAASDDCHPVVTLGELAHAEARLGFDLAPMHRRFYLEVANGHAAFECGLYGIPSVGGGHVDQGRSLLEQRAMLLTPPKVTDGHRHGELRALLSRAVPLCDLGCGQWCWSDVASAERMLLMTNGAMHETGLRLAAFCEAWLNDALHDALFVPGPGRAGINPFTKENTVFESSRPRGEKLLTYFE